MDSVTLLSIVIALLGVAALLLQHFHHSPEAATLMGAAVAIRALTGTPGVAPIANVGGGGAARQDCRPWLGTGVIPVLGQLVQVIPRGAERDTWYNDCGETCCSMIIRACRGVNVPPDALRERYMGDGSIGLTNSSDLVSILRGESISAHAVASQGNDGVVLLSGAAQDGRPVCAIGVWPTPGGVLHWLLVYRVDADKIYYINPWSASKSWMLHDDWVKASSNDYVVVDSHPLFP